MKDEKVTCDNCGSDLTSTGNSIGWRLALFDEMARCSFDAERPSSAAFGAWRKA